jgi:hypothetical protein
VEATRTASPREEALDGRVGRCPTCAAFTYDRHGLSEEQLRRLILETEGRALNRLVPRSDGRVMSIDCGHFPATRSRLVPALLTIALLIAMAAVPFGLRRLKAHDAPPLPPAVVEAPTASPPSTEAVAPVADPVAPPVDVTHAREPLWEWPPVDLEHERVAWRPQLDGDAPVTSTLNSDQLQRVARLDVHVADVVLSSPKGVQRSAVVPFVERRLPAFRECYFRALERNPDLRGALNVTAHYDNGAKLGTLKVDVPQSPRAVPTQLPPSFRVPQDFLQGQGKQRPAHDPDFVECVRSAARMIAPSPASASRNASLTYRIVFAGSF